jgi:chromosome segregation ATPase
MKPLQRYAEVPADGSAWSEPGEHCVPHPALQAYGAAVLDAVHQAVELIRTVEARATEAETRARAAALQAIEDMKVANARVLSIEEQRESAEAAFEEANSRAQEIEEALRREESQLADYEMRLSKAALRANSAEAFASDTEKTLTCVEAAIRINLLEHT